MDGEIPRFPKKYRKKIIDESSPLLSRQPRRKFDTLKEEFIENLKKSFKEWDDDRCRLSVVFGTDDHVYARYGEIYMKIYFQILNMSQSSDITATNEEQRKSFKRNARRFKNKIIKIVSNCNFYVDNSGIGGPYEIAIYSENKIRKVLEAFNIPATALLKEEYPSCLLQGGCCAIV